MGPSDQVSDIGVRDWGCRLLCGVISGWWVGVVVGVLCLSLLVWMSEVGDEVLSFVVGVGWRDLGSWWVRMFVGLGIVGFVDGQDGEGPLCVFVQWRGGLVLVGF